MCFFVFFFEEMFRIFGIVFFVALLTSSFGREHLEKTDVELDVVFVDTTFFVKYLYVISSEINGATGDTLALFDTLSFNRHDRVSLFYSVSNKRNSIISIVDSDGIQIESKPFRIRTTRRNLPAVFAVVVENRQVTVAKRDYLHFQKKGSLGFLVIFVSVKFLIMLCFVMLSTLPKRTIAVASIAFFASGVINWLIPHYFAYKILIYIPLEYLTILLIGRKFISWLPAAFLVLAVNISGLGVIALLYLIHMFW